MCTTCGCSDGKSYKIEKISVNGEVIPNHDHDHHHHGHENTHPHTHDHDHSHSHNENTRIVTEQDVLQKNNMLAERNRGYFLAKQITALNLVSSPGSGKTSLLERTIKELNIGKKLYVIEGDQQTANDAKRIHEAGAEAVQVNTGTGCHLDSTMVEDAVKSLNVADDSLLFIENVGNLVCPAMFDLGEKSRVVVMSVTEGEDKAIKYPYIFDSTDMCIINKIDLLPYVDFDVEKFKKYALSVNHHLEFLEVSVKSGENMEKWYDWLKKI